MKKLLTLIFLFLVPIFIFAEEVAATTKTTLINPIDEIESMKKELLEIQEVISTVQKECVATTCTNIVTAKDEIKTKPYRIAELSDDGVTPLPFAIERRKQNFELKKKKLIEDCEKQILEIAKDNITKKEQLLRDINTLYGGITDVTLNSKDGELVVNYKSYDGQNFRWLFDVLIKNDNSQIENTAYISFETLTGKDPELYSYKDYDGFCDKVDYYDSLFKTELSNYSFTVTLKSLPAALDSPSEYEINYFDLICHKESGDMNIPLTNNSITYKSEPAYDLYDLFSETESTTSLINFEFKFSDDYTLLPEGTEGFHGSDKQYLTFGYWPQTYKKPSVEINEKQKKNINGWECFEGSDGEYYVKQVSNNDCYIQGHRYEDNYYCEQASEYYFKLEPIKWCVLETKSNGDMFLISEKVLDTKKFYTEKPVDSYRDVIYRKTVYDDEICPNNYKYSSVRAYLNGLDGSSYEVKDYTNVGFINKAFSKEASQKIIPTNTKDTIERGYSETDTIELADKVIILSVDELNNPNYGITNNNRAKLFCDFAYIQANYLNWLTRSQNIPLETSLTEVEYDGDYGGAYVNDLRGVVPAITISK